MGHTQSSFWTVVLIAAIVEFYSLLPERNQDLSLSSSTQKSHWVQGIIHVHSTFSDGGGTPEEIAKAAHQAGHDFVILTDHNNDEARKKGFEKKYEGTDLWVEMESSTPVGHAVSFFSNSEKLRNVGAERVVQATYRNFSKSESDPDLFWSIAHPSNIKNPWSRLDEFGPGWEVVNFDSSWQRQFSEQPFKFLLTVGVYPFNEYLSALRFLETYPKDFVAWDEMTRRGPGHFAYLAHDTHSKVKLNQTESLNWPGYLQTFKMASNVVFLKSPKSDDFETRKKQVYEGLREGRLAVLYQIVAPFDGNDWRIDCDGKTFTVGDSVSFKESCEAVITTPVTPFVKVVRLVKNGEIIREVVVEPGSKSPLRVPLKGAGTYRLEVLAQKHTALRILLNRLVPYVFYNPIYLQ